MRSGVEGIPWKHGPPARDTSARAGVTHSDLDDGATNTISWARRLSGV